MNTDAGALWLSEKPNHGAGSRLELDATDLSAGTAELHEYEVCLLREACDEWLSEHAITDRGRAA